MKTFSKTPLALAITALMASPFALAGDVDVDVDKGWSTDVDITVEKDHQKFKFVDIFGIVTADAFIESDAFSQAYVESNQVNDFNDVINDIVNNDATMGNSGNSASGNVGINVTAGDNNQQANDAALALADANFVFASSEVDSLQTNTNQLVSNFKVANNARVNNSVNDVAGNLGLNVSAGANNQQHNAMAASVNTSFGNYAEADVVGMQHSQDNFTYNFGQQERTDVEDVQVSMTGDLTGTYSGDSDQANDYYPDTWTGDTHTGGTQTGHIDLDAEAQGAAQSDRDDISDAAKSEGGLLFEEAGDQELSGTFTGNLALISMFAEVPHMNNASLTNSLNNASGNVGVNVAAGAGNQQRNALAISAATGGAAGGGGE